MKRSTLPVFSDFVGGDRVGSGINTFDLVGPQNGAVIGLIEESGANGVDRAVKAATAAFVANRKQPAHQRIAILTNLDNRGDRPHLVEFSRLYRWRNVGRFEKNHFVTKTVGAHNPSGDFVSSQTSSGIVRLRLYEFTPIRRYALRASAVPARRIGWHHRSAQDSAEA